MVTRAFLPSYNVTTLRPTSRSVSSAASSRLPASLTAVRRAKVGRCWARCCRAPQCQGYTRQQPLPLEIVLTCSSALQPVLACCITAHTAARLQTVSKVFIPLRYSESLYGSEGCWAELLPQLIMQKIAETSKQKQKIYPQSNQNPMVRTLHQRLIRYPGQSWMMSPLEPGLYMALQDYIKTSACISVLCPLYCILFCSFPSVCFSFADAGQRVAAVRCCLPGARLGRARQQVRPRAAAPAPPTQ